MSGELVWKDKGNQYPCDKLWFEAPVVCVDPYGGEVLVTFGLIQNRMVYEGPWIAAISVQDILNKFINAQPLGGMPLAPTKVFSCNFPSYYTPEFAQIALLQCWSIHLERTRMNRAEVEKKQDPTTIIAQKVLREGGVDATIVKLYSFRRTDV